MITYAMQVDWAGSPSNNPNWGTIGNWSGFSWPIASLNVAGTEASLGGTVTFASFGGGPYNVALTWVPSNQSYSAVAAAGDNGFTETWNFNNAQMLGMNVTSSDNGNTLTGSAQLTGIGPLIARGSLQS